MKGWSVLLLIILVLAACTGDGPDGHGSNGGRTGSMTDGGLSGIGLRFDGYYREEVGKVVYLIRFFPEGNVVLANGTTDVEAQLPALLMKDAKGDPRTGYYNVPVTVSNDSLFFTTKATRGELSYSGLVVDGSRVRFLRHSYINGADHLKEYIFYPDPLPTK